MSEFSYLEKLLDGVEVKWLALENAAELKRGKRLVRSQLELEGEFAVYQNSMTPLGYYHQHNTNPDTTFVICAGAAGEIGYSSSPFWAADDVYYVASTNLLNSKFLYHYLLTQKNKISSQVRKASIPRLSKTSLDRIFVPIPCPNNPEKSLAIQSEIVRILDKFTALTAELTAELTARKKQYNYYRDQLLSFDEEQEKPIYLEKLLDGVEVEWKTLGQTCKIETGKLNANAAVDDGEYMFFTTAKETSKIDKFRWDTEALLIAGNANVGEVKHYIGKFEAYQRTYVLTNFDEKVSVRFLYFVLSHSLKKYLEERTNSAAMTYIVLSTLENFPIPIPCPGNPQKSLAIQSEIVRILDKFDTLTNSITEGLPREIELRQKQYEYYRDLLFSFPKPDSVTN